MAAFEAEMTPEAQNVLDVARTIEDVALEQLGQHREELSMGQIKVIAHQIAIESVRRLTSK